LERRQKASLEETIQGGPLGLFQFALKGEIEKESKNKASWYPIKEVGTQPEGILGGNDPRRPLGLVSVRLKGRDRERVEK
jgi:hypothetical protein